MMECLSFRASCSCPTRIADALRTEGRSEKPKPQGPPGPPGLWRQLPFPMLPPRPRCRAGKFSVPPLILQPAPPGEHATPSSVGRCRASKSRAPQVSCGPGAALTCCSWPSPSAASQSSPSSLETGDRASQSRVRTWSLPAPFGQAGRRADARRSSRTGKHWPHPKGGWDSCTGEARPPARPPDRGGQTKRLPLGPKCWPPWGSTGVCEKERRPWHGDQGELCPCSWGEALRNSPAWISLPGGAAPPC